MTAQDSIRRDLVRNVVEKMGDVMRRELAFAAVVLPLDQQLLIMLQVVTSLASSSILTVAASAPIAGDQEDVVDKLIKAVVGRISSTKPEVMLGLAKLERSA